MLYPSIFNENLFDDLMDFHFPEFRDFENIDKKLYGRHAAHVMKTDVHEHEDCYEVDIDLPGFKKEEITVELDKGYLTISASKGMDHDDNDKKGKLIRQERYAGSMTRSFYIGENVQKEDVEATYRHGVLTLTVPKKAIDKKIPEKNLIAIEG